MLLSCVWVFATPWNSPGQNTEEGSLSLLQGISPTQGLNPGLPHCRWIFYQLSHQGSPRILDCVPYPFSSGSSWPRNWIRVPCITRGFFTSWATREAHLVPYFCELGTFYYKFNFPTSDWSNQVFSLLDSVLAVLMFLEIFPFLLRCPVFWTQNC